MESLIKDTLGIKSKRKVKLALFGDKSYSINKVIEFYDLAPKSRRYTEQQKREAYELMRDQYNETVSELNRVERQRLNQLRIAETERLNQQRRVQQEQRRYANLIGRNVTRAINLNSQETISINVDANPLGNMKILLNKLVGYFPRKLGLRSNGVFYALNPFTLTRLLTLLDNRVLLETVEYISGTELIVAIEEVGDFTIDILPANEFVGQNMVEGGLFPYTHNLDKVDLTRYAIFHKNTN